MGEDVERLEPSWIAGGNGKQCCFYWKRKGSFSKERVTPLWSTNFTFRYILKRIESRDSYRYVCTLVHNSAIHNSQRAKATRVSVNRWADKPNVVHNTVEYHSALKRKKTLMHATLWRKLEAIIPSEISHLLRDAYNVIPLMWVS